ncbi:toll/interleukin-1 receptor domain-containing protein [Enterovirga rhinocerotis]|uniref:WD-40 repeat-containing protein n=1 Tax=Enterovirga rhinocerotis TaxID=1339210 RepID=A0A4R7BVK4_9HYPH|nr:TIR domain-containing protein [Enterovirga rhinocerotis]TDR89888.1 WD-40 repeat-containing protein [Enterovirga rhinocerotis]
MSRLFISHSSQNNPEAAALNLWLKEQGWDDVFLDVTPDRGIAAGERWERALNEAASRCEVVLFLVSRGWIASRWCRKEYELARRLNKRLLGALIEVIPVEDLPGEITETFQMADLASGSDHRMFRAELPRTHEEVHVTFSREGLFRLKDGLNKAGLDPRFFPWPPDHDPGRAPYRGLKPLEQEDAGIFFGREAPIVEGLDMLRGLAEMAAPRLFVILGASGAGKSSYLRAGLLPRLARDDRTFLSLPVIRPGGGAVSGEAGLLASIESAFQAHRIPLSRAAIRQAIAAGGAALKPLLAQLGAKVFAGMVTGEARKPPAITIAIDQAEEIFSDGEGEQLLSLVRDLVASDEPEVIVLFTIRSDAYDHLETAKPLEGLRQRALALLPMPRGAYQTVIEGPAARLSGTNRPLTIEPRLTQRLLQDIEKGGGSDALPLLAFTLGQLYVDFGGSGALGLADYEEFGGIQGAIEAAVRRVMLAADRDPRVPRDPEARLLLLRRGLIPWLAGIDPDTGSPRRRLARLSDIPADAEPLVRLLVEQRLLSVDRVTVKEGGVERTEVTVEPAHEALLRQWGVLRGWLDEDFAALAVLDGVKRGARDWEANARGPEWLSHTGTRLAEAEAIAARPDLGGIVHRGAAEYLAGCRERDDAEAKAREEQLENERRLKDSQVRLAEADKVAAEQKTQATRRFMRLAIAATIAVALGLAAAGGFAVLNHFQARERDDALAAAEAGRWVARSQGELRDDNAAAAVRSAYRAYRDRPREDTRSALLTALLDLPDLVGSHASPDPAQALVWLPDGSLGFASRGAALRSLVLPGRAAGGGWPSPRIGDLEAGHAMVRAFRFTRPDWLLASLSDGGIVGWGREGRLATGIKSGDGVVWAAAIGPAGRRIVRAEAEGTSIVTCGGEGPERPACAASTIGEDPPRSVAIDEAENVVAVGGEDGRLTLYDAAGVQQGEPIDLGSPVTALALSPRGERVAAGTQAGEIALFDVVSRALLTRTAPIGRPVTVLAFRPRSEPDAVDLAVSCAENAACLMRVLRDADGSWSLGPVTRLPGHKGAPGSLAWSADGALLGTAYADGLIRVWTPSPAADAVGARWHPRDAGRLSRIVTSPAGDLVAAAGDRRVTVFDRRTGGVLRTLRLGDGLDPRALAFAPDGRIAVVYEDGTLAIWPASGEAKPVLRRWDAKANPGVAWLDGGRLLAVALSDGRIALVDPGGGSETFLPSLGPGADAWGLAASPDGKALYASYVKGELRRWDVAAKTHTVLRAASPDLPPAERGAPGSLGVSPDGRWLAVTGDDEAVRLFETAGSGRRVLRTESPATRSVAFSPDGERLAALGTDGRAYVWRGAKGEGDPARDLAFEPSDGSARSASSRPADWLAWDGSGTLLAAVGGTVQVAPLDEAAWRRRAESLELRLADTK